MTIDIEQLRRDMAEGTQGPWYPVRNSAYWEINPKREIGDKNTPYSVADCCASDPGDKTGLQEKNARRIARLPNLEQAYLDAIAERDRLAEVAKAAEELAERVEEYAHMQCGVDEMERAAAHFRKATESNI